MSSQILTKWVRAESYESIFKHFTEKKNVQPELRTTSHDRMGKPMLLWREIINSFPSDNKLLGLLFLVNSTACYQMDLLKLHYSSTPKHP